MDKPIIILLNKYTGIEEESFEFALDVCDVLERKMGHTVYSPIVDSHPKWKWMQKNNIIVPHSYWMKRDFKMYSGFLNNDAWYQNKCPKCNTIIHPNLWDCPICNAPLHHPEDRLIHYDTGTIMVFADNCFLPVSKITAMASSPRRFEQMYFRKLDSLWVSKGAHKEYDFGVKRDVRRLLLSDFIKGVETEIYNV